MALAIEHGYLGARRTAMMQTEHPDKYPDVDKVWKFWIESKRYKKTPVNRLARKELRDRPGFYPVLAYRDDGEEWFAVMKLTELLKLGQEAQGRLPASLAEAQATEEVLGSLEASLQGGDLGPGLPEK